MSGSGSPRSRSASSEPPRISTTEPVAPVQDGSGPGPDSPPCARSPGFGMRLEGRQLSLADVLVPLPRAIEKPGRLRVAPVCHAAQHGEHGSQPAAARHEPARVQAPVVQHKAALRPSRLERHAGCRGLRQPCREPPARLKPDQQFHPPVPIGRGRDGIGPRQVGPGTVSSRNWPGSKSTPVPPSGPGPRRRTRRRIGALRTSMDSITASRSGSGSCRIIAAS